MTNPLNPVDAWEEAKRNSTADVIAPIEDMFAAGKLALVKEGEKPDILIGGRWPGRPGAVRATCSMCAAYVGLTPAGGAAVLSKYPDVRIVCFPCAPKTQVE